MTSILARTLFIAAMVFNSATHAIASPQTDANYIAQQTLTKEMFEGALIAQRPLILSAIQNDLRNNGVILKKPEAFFDLFMGEFVDEFTLGMREEGAQLYLDTFTPKELSDIATFYKSETGQSFLKKTPALMQTSFTLGEKVGARAGMRVAPSLKKRIRDENLLELEDRSVIDKLLNILR